MCEMISLVWLPLLSNHCPMRNLIFPFGNEGVLGDLHRIYWENTDIMFML